MNLINYTFAREGHELTIPQGMYEYTVARNGLFIRAARPGLLACIPAGRYYGKPPAGLLNLPFHVATHSLVTSSLLRYMLDISQRYATAPAETLFWLTYKTPSLPKDAYHLEIHIGDVSFEVSPWIDRGYFTQISSRWSIHEPQQVRSAGSVYPVSPHDPLTQNVLIEVHSHHNMTPFFSQTDNSDETGFRIYAVIGNLSTRPTIRTRIGIYGNFCEIPSAWVFDLAGSGLADADELDGES